MRARRLQRGGGDTAAATPSYSSSSYVSRRRLSGASGYAAILGLSNLDDDVSPLPPRKGFRREEEELEERVSEQVMNLSLH